MAQADYEERKAAKAERLRRRAEGLRTAAAAREKRNDTLAGVMNGTPILVGHHSEKRHRRDLDRMHRDTGKAIEERETAAKCERRAERAESGRGPISADDPAAVEKLRAKIAKAERLQQRYKDYNRVIRSKPKNEITDTKLAELDRLGLPNTLARKAFEPDFAGRIGFAPYLLTNLGANIRRMRERVESLKKAETVQPRGEVDRGAYRVVENAEENRLQLIFPGKPSAEVRSVLKRNGFRWAPSQGAWQRQLTANAHYAEGWIHAELAKL